MQLSDGVRTSQLRITLLALMLTFGLAVMVGQLVRFQVVEHPKISATSQAQVLREITLPSSRGYIADRNGHVLALDVVEWSISASPSLITRKKAELSVTLAQLLELPQPEVLAALNLEQPWVLLKNHVPQEVGEQIAELGLSGIQCDPRPLRVYPEGALTSHLLGIVNANGDGYYGMEAFYDDRLRPVAGTRQSSIDSGGQEIPGAALRQEPARKGASLVLTIDLNIQFMADQELARAIEQYDAAGGTVLIMQPSTGAILASVSRPGFEPPDFATTDPVLLADPTVAMIWEPGSIFKIVTWASGLDSGVINVNTQFNDRGVLEVGGRAIVNSDRAAHGVVTAEEGLLYSLNTFAAHISTAMGQESFYAYVRRFGFGSPSGVDLAGEVAGMVKRPGDSDWFPSDLGTNAFGQGIAITPLQMVSAVSAVANGGKLMKPFVVQALVVPQDGSERTSLTKIQPTVVRSAISAEAAATLTDMLVNVVERSSSKARVPGYRVAGKTGTAEIPTAAGYLTSESIHSYVGFAPADDPQFVVLVKLDRPKAGKWAADTAAPTFSAIVQRLLLYLQVPPDSFRLAPHAGQP